MADDTGGRAVRDLAAHGLDTRQHAVESAFTDVIKALRSGEDPTKEDLKKHREELALSRDIVDQYLRRLAEEQSFE